MNGGSSNPAKGVHEKPGLTDYLKAWPLYLLPHHWVSAVIYRLTRIHWLKNPVIRTFIRLFNVDMTQSRISDIREFEHFNAFFTRELKPSARPIIEAQNKIACPADGAVSAIGDIVDGRVFQAKGHDFSLTELLGGDEEAAEHFRHGKFMTVYLSPRDYHRLHMPFSGKLFRQTHVPGRLFSVAPHTVKTIPRLFARNERLVTLFDTDIGRMGLVLVGAINVASIETVWAGEITPPGAKKITQTHYSDGEVPALNKGQEMGRFNMGSTIIVLFERKIDWDAALSTGTAVQMGQSVGAVQ